MRIYKESVLDPLAYFFRHFFDLDVWTDQLEKADFPTFEEAIGLLDLALINREEFVDFPETAGVGDQKVSAAREHLLVLIADALLTEQMGQETYHYKLVKNLTSRNLLTSTAFLSFNYDTLIDNALLRTIGAERIDYSFSFRWHLHLKGPKDLIRAADPVQLLKLHGSLNWIYCAGCRAVDLGDDNEVRRIIPGLSDGTPFCSCGNLKRTTLVPPTFFKSLSNLYLMQIWNAAELALRKARRIIFCGYSFPDADIYFKYLLKRVQIQNRDVEVTVINYYPGKPSNLLKEEKTRYRRFLGAKVRLRYNDISFQEFAEDPAIIDHGG